ncbi:MAG: DUF4091 domain-containing protein [Myxococcales bacterium]|nr:DUF4091 domain-containing protein [Myxococcota bacterium]MDW8283396.1 DUF4091 domain-containing protein [Myxococcales bacterium]
MRPRGSVLWMLLVVACLRPPSRAAPLVAIVDDSERIARRDGDRAVLRGVGNPVWAPGQPVRLFGLPGETVALQVVVTAAQEPLRGVTVELPALEGPVRLANQGSGRFQPIERFVVAELELRRRSGGRHAGESLGWAPGAMPPGPRPPTEVPEPLIPIELAPPWADYPMTVAPGEHRVVWIDLTLPEQGLPPGVYRGELRVAAGAKELARQPVLLEVGHLRLPYAAVRTMVYYDPQEIRGVTGSDEAVRHYLQLMHRHHLSTIFRIDGPADVAAQRDELTGALFTAAHGYDGPGAGRGADVIALGTYGSLGMPTPERLGRIEQTMRALEEAGVLASRPTVFLYAADERCDSPAGPAWRTALDGSASPQVRAVLVGHTCSASPLEQRVDLAMVHAAAYNPVQAERAVRLGKRVWIYNGSLPATGSFLTDGGVLSLRANGWIQARYGIERWFYWESTFWNDDNRGGHGPYDPLLVAETFHNHHGDWANGDGVLVYPGRQVAAGRRSLGFAGVIASLRLKQWRRGISDAGYLQLCRQAGGEVARQAEAEAARLIPRALSQAEPGPAPWPQSGAPYVAARRRLFDLLHQKAPPLPAR